MRKTAGLLALLVAAPAFAACTTSETCYDWVAYESTERMREDASSVIEVDRVEAVGTTDWSGVEANVYEVRVSGIPVGDTGAVQEIGGTTRVVSTPQTCSSSAYPDGDPMLRSERLRLYLVEDDGQRRTLTPFAGVELR